MPDLSRPKPPSSPTDGDEGSVSSEPEASRFAEALRLHRLRVEDVLPTGEPEAIKGLYVELGDLLAEAAGEDVETTPVLSFPETGPVVAAMAAGFRGRVLDAGCGPNPTLSILLARDPNRRVVALDISDKIVRMALGGAEVAGARLLGVVGDVESLPFRDGAFDACVCEDTIEHLPDEDAGVRELARILRDGGRLLLGTPNRIRLDVLRSRYRDLRRRRRRPVSAYYAATSHLREHTWWDLRRLVRRHFRVRGRATVGWSGGPRARLASRLVRHWPFRLVGRMVILELEPRR